MDEHHWNIDHIVNPQNPQPHIVNDVDNPQDDHDFQQVHLHQEAIDEFYARIQHLRHLDEDYRERNVNYPELSNPNQIVRFRQLFNLYYLLINFDVNSIIERLVDLNRFLNQLFLKHNEINGAEMMGYDTIPSLFLELQDIMSNINNILQYSQIGHNINPHFEEEII